MGSKYLMIENRGVASVDLLTIVGASTARGQSEMIGQFGSGFKYSLAALLRESRNVFLYIGKDGYEFGVDERGTKGVDDKDFAIREVVMKQVAGSSRRKKPMGFDVSFGEIDWKDPWLPVREFISNAADASQALNGNYKDVKVELVEEGQVRAKDGYTRVFIQADSAIRGCYDQVPERFLIFRPTFKADTTTIIPKRSNGDKVLIYRKGVLVGEFPYPSLFNYNLNDIELKESRVISESNARDACGTAIRNADTASLVEFLQAVRDHIDLWETTHISTLGSVPTSAPATAPPIDPPSSRALRRVLSAAAARPAATSAGLERAMLRGYLGQRQERTAAARVL